LTSIDIYRSENLSASIDYINCNQIKNLSFIVFSVSGMI